MTESSASRRERHKRSRQAAGWRATVASLGGFTVIGTLVVVVLAVGAFVWSTSAGGGAESTDEIPIGQNVEGFELPDVTSGETVRLSEYLAERPVVIVSYMGFFCSGCDELLVELERYQSAFEERGAQLIVMGSLPEPMDLAAREAAARGLTYPLLYDTDHSVLGRLGLWSDYMEMPLMGYVIIDESGEVVAGEQVLSEQPQAGAANVEQILAALDEATVAEAETPSLAGGPA